MSNVFGTIYQLIFGLGKGEIPVGTSTQCGKLSAGTNGQAIVYDSSQTTGLKAATLVDDTAYDATSWNSVTDVAPSKNAVRDKLVSIDATFGSYQPLDTELTAIAGLTSAADKTIEFTGSGTAGTYTVTAAAKTVLDDTTVAAMVNTIGGAEATGTGGLVRVDSPTFTGRVNLPASTTSLASFNVASGSVPTSPNDGDFFYSSSILRFRIGAASSIFVFNNVITTFTVKQIFRASTTTSPSIQIQAGALPTSGQSDGDISFDGTLFYARVSSANQSFVTSTNTVTMTNKTLTSPTLTGKTTVGSIAPALSTYSPSSGGTATLDCNASNSHLITMPAGNITVALSNVTTGQTVNVIVLQDSVGSRTVTWFSTIKWDGGSAPTSSGANKYDVYTFVCYGSGTYLGARSIANA